MAKKIILGIVFILFQSTYLLAQDFTFSKLHGLLEKDRAGVEKALSTAKYKTEGTEKDEEDSSLKTYVYAHSKRAGENWAKGWVYVTYKVEKGSEMPVTVRHVFFKQKMYDKYLKELRKDSYKKSTEDSSDGRVTMIFKKSPVSYHLINENSGKKYILKLRKDR